MTGGGQCILHTQPHSHTHSHTHSHIHTETQIDTETRIHTYIRTATETDTRTRPRTYPWIEVGRNSTVAITASFERVESGGDVAVVPSKWRVLYRLQDINLLCDELILPLNANKTINIERTSA